MLLEPKCQLAVTQFFSATPKWAMEEVPWRWHWEYPTAGLNTVHLVSLGHLLQPHLPHHSLSEGAL